LVPKSIDPSDVLVGFEPFVRSCLWLRFQQQVRWLQLGPLMVYQSFLALAVAFLVGIPLEGGPSEFEVLTTGFVFGSFGPTSFEDDTSHKWDYLSPSLNRCPCIVMLVQSSSHGAE
jgi:hypothetical protein